MQGIRDSYSAPAPHRRQSLLIKPVGNHRQTRLQTMVFAVPIAMMSKTIFGVAILAFTLVPLVRAQNENYASAKQKSNAVNRGIDRLFHFLNMAGTAKAAESGP